MERRRRYGGLQKFHAKSSVIFGCAVAAVPGANALRLLYVSAICCDDCVCSDDMEICKAGL